MFSNEIQNHIRVKSISIQTGDGSNSLKYQFHKLFQLLICNNLELFIVDRKMLAMAATCWKNGGTGGRMGGHLVCFQMFQLVYL